MSLTPPAVAIESAPQPAPTSLAAKLTNVFVAPGEVFEEVAVAPSRRANWLVPTLLVCVASLVLLTTATTKEQTAAAVNQLVEAGQITTDRVAAVAGNWRRISALATCAGVFGGTFWTAFLLWFIGRAFLRTRFAFGKALEVAGLAGVIPALGAIVTGCLIAASGDAAARPALSLLARPPAEVHAVYAVLQTLNLFHVWTTALLALGLARLSGVSFKESAVWVFGYWFAVRIAILVLALA